MLQLNKNKPNMMDSMGKYYLKQMIFQVLYIREHICIIKNITKGRLQGPVRRERVAYRALSVPNFAQHGRRTAKNGKVIVPLPYPVRFVT